MRTWGEVVSSVAWIREFSLLFLSSFSFLVFSEARQISQAAGLFHVLFLTLATAAVLRAASPCWIPGPHACVLRGVHQGGRDKKVWGHGSPRPGPPVLPLRLTAGPQHPGWEWRAPSPPAPAPPGPPHPFPEPGLRAGPPPLLLALPSGPRVKLRLSCLHVTEELFWNFKPLPLVFS